ncbi:hypothetical protein D3C85_1661740 [compost metagenome]
MGEIVVSDGDNLAKAFFKVVAQLRVQRQALALASHVLGDADIRVLRQPAA